MTPAFRIEALPSADLARIRDRGVDDFGNPVLITVDHDPGGAPLRCCLRDAVAEERVALIAWRPASTGGAYAEVGPVFVHADSCQGYDAGDRYPEGFRHRSQIFRAYDADGRQVDNRIVEGDDAEVAIAELFSRPDVAYLHSRNVLAGCYMFTIARA